MEQERSLVRCPWSVRDRVLVTLLAIDLAGYVVKLEGAHAMNGRRASIKHYDYHIGQGRHAPCLGPQQMT